jgi:putative ABC transport system substrate-binding protein
VRRRLLQGAAALVAGAAPSWLHAQPRAAHKIGYLHPRTVNNPTRSLLANAWRHLGYVEGDTVLLRSADDDVRRLPGLARELVAQGAGVLIVVGAEALRLVAREITTTPIVAIDLETDPVRSGYATSFAHPGGNVTGLFLDMPSIAGKWIDLLREAAPDIERIALSWDPSTGTDQLEVAKVAARGKGFDALVLELHRLRAFDAALKPLGGRPRTGIVQLSSPGFAVVVARFAAAARRHRIPVIAFLKSHVRDGLLMSYGPIQEQYFPRAVALADRILKGAVAGELPIEAPDRFELAINQATAHAIGVTIPPSLLLRADEVIE